MAGHHRLDGDLAGEPGDLPFAADRQAGAGGEDVHHDQRLGRHQSGAVGWMTSWVAARWEPFEVGMDICG